MHHRLRQWSFLALALTLLAGCAEPIPQDRLHYVGEWRSPEMHLLILADGSVSYERLENGVTTSINAPLQEFVGDDFVVGVGAFNTTFHVSQPPTQVDGEWIMVVDGVKLRRTGKPGGGQGAIISA